MRAQRRVSRHARTLPLIAGLLVGCAALLLGTSIAHAQANDASIEVPTPRPDAGPSRPTRIDPAQQLLLDLADASTEDRARFERELDRSMRDTLNVPVPMQPQWKPREILVAGILVVVPMVVIVVLIAWWMGRNDRRKP